MANDLDGAEKVFRKLRASSNGGRVKLPRSCGGKNNLFCHSERSEESLFGLNTVTERFLGAQRTSE
jgi:hypothetical protein